MIDKRYCVPLKRSGCNSENESVTPEIDTFTIWEDSTFNIGEDDNPTGGDLAGGKTAHAIRNGRRGSKKQARYKVDAETRVCAETEGVSRNEGKRLCVLPQVGTDRLELHAEGEGGGNREGNEMQI